MAETNIINRIAIHATAETAPPTLASKGSNITQSAWSTAGFETFGGRVGFSDDLDLDQESVGIVMDRQISFVDPPRGMGYQDAIPTKNRITEVTFQCYDGSEALLTLDSDMSVASNVAELALTGTKRTLCIEVNGLWVDYFGTVLLQVTDLPGGAIAGEGVQKTMVRATVLGGTAADGGLERRYYV